MTDMTKPASTMTSTSNKGNVRVVAKRISSGIMDEHENISFESGWASGHCKDNSFSSYTSRTESSSSYSSGDNEDLSSVGVPCVVEVSNIDGHCNINPVLKSMIDQLSDHEKEVAARSSYAYYKMRASGNANSSAAASCASSNLSSDARDQAAMSMAARHLRADGGDVDTAMKHVKATIQWRQDRRLDVLRHCFEESSEEAMDFRTRLQNFIGDKGKLIIQGFDKEHRACWHTVGRHSPEGTQSDHDGCMLAHFYYLERAIACSEARSLKYGLSVQETVIVSVDFKGFQKQHAPLLNTVKELLFGLRDHYPERLFRVYLIDAPFLFRSLWSIIKPILDPDTKAKFQFVTGTSQRTLVFNEAMGSEECMPYMHPDGKLSSDIDMDEFYKLPFDLAYGGDESNDEASF